MIKNYLHALLTLLFIIPCQSAVIYVKTGGTGNGTSWANAYGSLATAFQNAQSGDEIWVQQGTYKPTTGTDANVSFVFKNGVKVYGGFSGSETTLAQRADTTGTTTILSGLLNETVHSKTILKIKNAASSLNLLDGFTIRDAHWVMTVAQNGGAGVQIIGSKIEFKNVHVKDNQMVMENLMPFDAGDSLVGGAGVYSRQSELKFRNVHIDNNNFTLSHSTPQGYVAQGAASGLYVLRGKLNFKQGSIDGNTLNNTNYNIQSGATLFSLNDSLHLEGIFIQNNVVSGYSAEGSGLYVRNTANVKLVNNVFHNNYNALVYNLEGSGVALYFSTATIVNNTFGRSNHINVSPAPQTTKIYYSTVTFNNCAFLERISQNNGSAQSVTYNNCITGNTLPLPSTQNNVTTAVMEFMNPVTGNYTPKACGTHLDGGSEAYTTATTDIMGNARVAGNGIDYGAIELQNKWENRVYVDVNSVSTQQDGASWDSPYKSLYEALDCGCDQQPAEIWVAEGTYRVPWNDLGFQVRSFNLNEGQKVYGGFVNGAETLAQRDTTFLVHPTILSGISNNDHIYCVVRAENTTLATELNGFILQEGYAVQVNGPVNNNSGAGLYISSGSATINNVWVRNNTSRQRGGGVVIYNSGIVSNYLKVTDNTSLESMGGGIGYIGTNNLSTYPESLYNHLEVSTNSAQYGGGICTDKDFPITIQNFSITGNTTVHYGGGLYIIKCPVTLISGVIENNQAVSELGFASSGGGGIYIENIGRPNYNFTLESVLFANNNINGYGGAIAAFTAKVFANNCTFVSNEAASGSFAWLNDLLNTYVSVKNSIFVNDGLDQDIWIAYAQSDANENITVEHSLFTGSIPFLFTDLGDNMVNTDPQFVDAVNADYRLVACGNAVDVGVNSFATLGTSDADYNPRIKNGTIDLGAFEYQYVDLAYTTQPQDITVTPGATATFTVATNNEDITYQWQVSTDNGVTWADITNATQPVLTVYNVTQNMHHYLYRCILADCANTLASGSGLLSVSTVNGLDNVAFTGLALYPNPGNSQFSLQYANAAGDTQLRVFDLNGRVIHTCDITPQQLADGFAVNVSGWANGVYVVQLNGNGQAAYRFVKY